MSFAVVWHGIPLSVHARETLFNCQCQCCCWLQLLVYRTNWSPVLYLRVNKAADKVVLNDSVWRSERERERWIWRIKKNTLSISNAITCFSLEMKINLCVAQKQWFRIGMKHTRLECNASEIKFQLSRKCVCPNCRTDGCDSRHTNNSEYQIFFIGFIQWENIKGHASLYQRICTGPLEKGSRNCVVFNLNAFESHFKTLKHG